MISSSLRNGVAKSAVLVAWLAVGVGPGVAVGQATQHGSAEGHAGHHHGHHHGTQPVSVNGQEDEEVDRPTVFLDKSPRIVAYQLSRLDNRRLLLVERSTDDPKYAPVYAAILSRDGMSPLDRDEALAGLVEINESSRALELVLALESIAEPAEDVRTIDELATMLLDLPTAELQLETARFQAAASSDQPHLRAVGMATLNSIGETEIAWQLAQQKAESKQAWVESFRLTPDAAVLAELRPQLVALLSDDQPETLRVAAIESLAFERSDPQNTFVRVAELVGEDALRDASVRTLLTVPREAFTVETAAPVVSALVDAAEATPAANRTDDNFVEWMQLVDQLLPTLSLDEARGYRSRLEEITVRLILINTVEEEMRYDVKYFAVEAGQTVQVILHNEDLMAHNLVITKPGALQEVALQGLAAGPNGGYQGKQYVPENDNVLFATDMVQNGQRERLTFEAPAEPGEYPYVCTFPQHWMRMYGVMVVVEDLEAWSQNPVEPKDPIGSNRAFVQSWQMEDFEADLESGLRGRSQEIGERLFAEATCAQCHQINGEGGQVGPDLAGVFGRLENDPAALLRELLEPSHKIAPEYVVYNVLTLDGVVVSGIIVEENDESITLLVSPDAPEPTVILQDDIDIIEKTSQSIMPKALLDTFSKDEVFEILSYLTTATANDE